MSHVCQDLVSVDLRHKSNSDKAILLSKVLVQSLDVLDNQVDVSCWALDILRLANVQLKSA